MVRVRVAVALWPPLVPVTVRVAIVGAFGAVVCVALLFPPPPQATIPEITKAATPARTIFRLFFWAAHKPPIRTAAKVTGRPHNFGEADWAWSVVATETVIGTEMVLDEKPAVPGFRLQLTPAGAPAQESTTLPTKLFLLPRTRLYVAVCPAVTVAEVLPPGVNANVAAAFTVTVVLVLVVVPRASVNDPVTV